MSSPLREHAHTAVALLGWGTGHVVTTELLGRPVTVAATLIPEAHQHRATTGWPPVTDRIDVGLWTVPGIQGPPPAVRLHGVVTPSRHWPTALHRALPFFGMCPVVLLLPDRVAIDANTIRTPTVWLWQVGIAATRDGTVDILREPPPVRRAVDPTSERLVLEHVYDHVLNNWTVPGGTGEWHGHLRGR